MTKLEVLQAIQELASRQELSQQDVLDAYRQGRPARRIDGGELNSKLSTRHLTITHVLYGIGGIIVTAGIIFLIQQAWDSFTAWQQIAITLGSAIAIYLAAVLLNNYEKYREVSTLFFVISAVIMPVGIFVTLHHLSPGDNVWLGQLIMAGIPAVVFAISYYHFKHPLLILVTTLLATWTLYASVGFMLDGQNASEDFATKVWAYLTLLTGTSCILLGHSWKKTLGRWLLGAYYFLGAGAALGAGFSLTNLQDPWIVIYFLLILAAMYLGTTLRSRSFLIFGAIALVAHLTRISFDYFADSFGWPLALIITGFIIIGVGYSTVSLSHRYISQHPKNAP